MRALLEKDEEDGFELRFFDAGRGRLRLVPSEGMERLVADLGMRGRVLVTLAREVGVDGSGSGSGMGRSGGPVLKREFRERAREMVVEDVGGGGDGGVEVGEGSGAGVGVEKEAGGKGSARKGGVPKWLKLPGKK